MNRNLMKLMVLVVTSIASWQIASDTLNTFVLEIERKESTFVDVMIQQQVAETLKEAEKKIEEVAKEENIVIKQEEVVVKPAQPPKEIVKEEVAEEKEEASTGEVIEKLEVEEGTLLPEQETATTPEQGVGDGLTSDTIAGLTVLSEEEITYLTNYLIDYYFLFGERYYTIETDPVRYERKKLANDMENYIIGSIGEVQGLMQNVFSMTSEDLRPILEKTCALEEAFRINYATVGKHGEAFQEIYDESMVYFDTYKTGLTHAISTFETLETTTNKALVLPLMLKRINQDILPAIKDILNQGFLVKEKTNQIYIEGIDGSFLLTPEEVMAILQNPQSVLPQVETTTDASTETEVPDETSDVSTEVAVPNEPLDESMEVERSSELTDLPSETEAPVLTMDDVTQEVPEQ